MRPTLAAVAIVGWLACGGKKESRPAGEQGPTVVAPARQDAAPATPTLAGPTTAHPGLTARQWFSRAGMLAAMSEPVIEFTTSHGTFVVALDPVRAPATV